jgi:small multidrug resistance family-3 protein
VLSAVLFILAGLFEIGGGYLVWIWLREGKGLGVGIAGFILLAVYGIVPVFQPKEHPFGRIYAAYGAIFIVLSIFWGWGVDSKKPDVRDFVGAAICVVGAFFMMWPRKG